MLVFKYRLEKIQRLINKDRTRIISALMLAVFSTSILLYFVSGQQSAFAKQPDDRLFAEMASFKKKNAPAVLTCGDNIYFYDKREGTVADMLSALDIVCSDNDILSCKIDEEIFPGMEISLTKKIDITTSSISVVEPKTVYRENDMLCRGTTFVAQAGKAGLLKTFITKHYENKEVKAVKAWQETIIPAQDEIIMVGTKEPGEYEIPVQSDFIESIDSETGTVTITFNGETFGVEKVLDCKATAYCPCFKCSESYDRLTSTGTVAKQGTVAVDPSVIPYGTKMFIVSNDGTYIYGYSAAEDTGGAIVGNRIDLFYETHNAALQFGVRQCTVYILV